MKTLIFTYFLWPFYDLEREFEEALVPGGKIAKAERKALTNFLKPNF